MKNKLDEKLAERIRIVEHVRDTAHHILGIAIADPTMDLERADVIRTVLEDVANSIEEGGHWPHMN